MSKNNSGSVKSSCYLKNSPTSNHKNCKANKCIPKKVIISRNITSNGADFKSCSASVVNSKQYRTKSKKTTQSDISFTPKCPSSKTADYCRKCGDELEKSKSFNKINEIVNAVNVKSVKNDNNVNIKKKSSKPIQQYYRNENFCLSTGSVPLDTEYIRKDSLDTIKETSEPTTYSQDSVFMIYSDSDDDNTITDIDDSLEKLKQFRTKNYFECHSVKSKIKNKPNVINLDNHKCVYRFYLNDRLFPVPLNSDYNNRIRCVECHLPMDIKKDSKDENINGTIQAKVKLGKETHNMMLLLPIKESLVIKEKRRETKREDNDKYVYFGVVKLSADGNSVFNKTLPNDSLALRYQKGYKEFKLDKRYAYENMADADVVII